MSITQVPSQPNGAPPAADARLIRHLRSGDEGAFEALFRRHYPALLSFCRHMLGNQQEAEDALQQTFIRAHRALLGDSPPRELRPWLYVVARNCCRSAIAARKPADEHHDQEPSLVGLTEQVRVREDLRELVTDISRLPDDQRSALLLAELEDLNHEAIATVVGCPVSKVKALIYQARATLMAERDARNASCQQIREQLSVARGGELRRGGLRRHLRLCPACRDFQTSVSAQRQSLALVLPVLASPALAAKLLGAGALKAASSSAATGAVAGSGAAGGGSSVVAGTSGLTSAATSAGAGAGATTGSSAVGGMAVGSSSVGTSGVIGGTVVKAAVTGAIAIAGAGAVLAHNHLAGKGHRHHTASKQVASLRKLSNNTPDRKVALAQETTAGAPESTQQSGAQPALTGTTGATGVPAEATGTSTAPQPALIGTLPSLEHTPLPGQPASSTTTSPASGPNGSSTPVAVSEIEKSTTSVGKTKEPHHPAKRERLRARELRERRLAKEQRRREHQLLVTERHRRAREARERRERLRQQRLAREREAKERREREAREKREAREARKRRETEAQEKREAREARERRETEAQEKREAREARERREAEARERREAASQTRTITTATANP